MMLSDASLSIPAFAFAHLFTATVLAALGFGIYVMFSYRSTTKPARIRRLLGGHLDRFAQVPAGFLDARLVAADEDLRFGWWGFACAFGWGLLLSLGTDFDRLSSARFSGLPVFVPYILRCLPLVAYILAVPRLRAWLILRRLQQPASPASHPA